jgi:DNA primase
LEQFGVGVCRHGSLSGRVAIPLYRSENELIGYASRITDDSQISETNPKYLFPSKHQRGGRIYEFSKSQFLYNGWRFTKPAIDLIVVEGFPSVWWLTQVGFPECVAIMGSSMSEEQFQEVLRISAPQSRIWVFADGDKAGRRCAEEICSGLSEDRLVRNIVQNNKQPTDFTEPELKSLLGW